jgi:hypothetical protein
MPASETNRPRRQERIAADIAQRLADLPPELRERIRKEAGVTELSAAALKRTGAIAAVGGALVGTVGIAGFAAYTTLTSVITTAAGFVGLTLPVCGLHSRYGCPGASIKSGRARSSDIAGRLLCGVAGEPTDARSSCTGNGGHCRNGLGDQYAGVQQNRAYRRANEIFLNASDR